MTYDEILEQMLERVPDHIDKREGSIIYDALAPVALELSRMFVDIESNRELSYADTASGEYLERRTAEFGVNRLSATKSVRKGLFFGAANAPIDVPLGSRYSINSVNYVAMKKIAIGQYQLQCESVGIMGNQQFGAMLPIDYIANLSRAELSDVLVPGEDEEDDETLRERYFVAVNEKPFGGNVADYKKKLLEMDGVGGIKVHAAWQGGGTVKCILLGSDFKRLSDTLIRQIQNDIDPPPEGSGIGLAPIGHKVTIANVKDGYIYVEVILALGTGVTPDQIKPIIEAAVEEYFVDLRRTWDQEAQLVVRIAQIQARILSVSGVKDILDTQLIYNGQPAVRTNITLEGEEIPILTNVGVFV